MATCPCQSEREYDECCGPFLAGAAPPTAEALMRSRYTAYTRGNVDYILATHDPESSDDADRESIEKWSKEAEWQGLEIVSKEAGGPDDKEGAVEFIARYKQEGKDIAHHERATFRRAKDRWLLVNGEPVKTKPIIRGEKIGRNDPCPCGSGKKYKKCHGG